MGQKMNAENRSIIPGYPGLADFTGASIPLLRKLVNRADDPLPCVRMSERKVVFVAEDVLAWFKDEAKRQAGEL